MERIKSYLEKNKEQLWKRCKSYLWAVAGQSSALIAFILTDYVEQEYAKDSIIYILIANIVPQVTKYLNRKKTTNGLFRVIVRSIVELGIKYLNRGYPGDTTIEVEE